MEHIKIFIYIRMEYHKKQRKHTRSIFLNSDEAFYVSPDRKQFTFRFAPINIEDESIMYVKNTNVDYRTGSGLSVQNVKSGIFRGSTATYSATYSESPAISFLPQDGKGGGATAIGILAPSGVSGSATSTTTSVAPTIIGAGYTGTPPTIPANVPLTGGVGATLTPVYNATTGALETATLVAGSAYVDVPTFDIPAPQASVPATFGAVPFNASTGVITGMPTITNPTTNGFYNGSLFTISFVNNRAPAFGTGTTNASGTFTNLTITNGGTNGYFGTDAPPTISVFDGDGMFGTGLAFTPTYVNGSLTALTITNGGSGYPASRTNAPLGIQSPPDAVPAMITGRTITNGRLTGLTLGSGGSKYRNPTISITAGLVAPVQGAYDVVHKIPAPLAGARMLTHGYGYTLPPKPIINSTYRVSNNGDLPLIAEITQPYNVEKNNYYTIKADGFHFSRTLYTNTDNIGSPTLSICSQNEDVNNENYTELILPAQVINQLTITITDRDGNGLDPLKNMTILLTIEELDHEDTEYKDSKRQLYENIYSVS
jgi:hypothetical protein